jgi:aldehyde dehydrogenase (NAD+)
MPVNPNVKRYSAGSTLAAGGEGHFDGLRRHFVRPTLFADVTNEMTVAREEIFGPVQCILTYRNEDRSGRHRQRHQ